METVLVINGKQTGEFSRGGFNQGLFDATVETLEAGYTVLTTTVEEGYDPAAELEKFQAADAVIYQYPIYWFMMPPTLKRYIDEVYAYGAFFAFNDGPYGSGGLMGGKSIMLSTTWNSPSEAFADPDAFFRGGTVDDMLAPMRLAHVYCGFEELPHFSSHDVIKNPTFDADRERLVAHLKTVFPKAASAAA